MQRIKMLAWGLWYCLHNITLEHVAALILFGGILVSIALFGGIDLHG